MIQSARPAQKLAPVTPPAPAPPVPPQHSKGPTDHEVHLLDGLAVVHRYRYVAAAVFVLTSAAIMIQGYSGERMYEAQGRLLIEMERATIPGLAATKSQYEDPQLYYNTQHKILKGRDLTRRVVRKLHLEDRPEFNGTAAPPRTPMTVVGDLVGLVRGGMRPRAVASNAVHAAEQLDEGALIDAFLSRVAVEPVRDSRLVDVSFISTDPQFAAQAANTLMAEYVEQNLAAKSQTSQAVRIVDRAEVPKGPTAPTGRRPWMMALAIGLGMALAAAFGLDYMNDTIKTPEDVSQRLKLPFLGLVPAVRGATYPLLASAQVPHEFGESFRALRTALVSRYTAPGTKILVVTSAQPLEGKTITAVNIAMALAYGGARVLLIDADMRRPGLHRPLRLTNERGLSQVLAGQARVRDVIQRTVDTNLLAITAGTPPANPSELLASERMKTLLANLGYGAFDWILIDTPPVLAVTDAVVLAPSVAGVVYVVGAEMTRRRLAHRAVETIQSANPRSVTSVLNKVDFARNKYYYSRYYGPTYSNCYAGASA